MGEKGLQKSLRSYLARLRKVPSHLHIRGSPHPSSAAAANWLLSACKYPRTRSFADGRRCSEDRPSQSNAAAATLSDIDRFLQENFNSLYSRGDDAAEDYFSSEPPRYDYADPSSPPNGFRSSERFFVSPGTSSNSLVEEDCEPPSAGSPEPSSSSRPSDEGAAASGGRVAVMTFSNKPYNDFRRSMEEMVEARHAGRTNQELDWDFMEELLFCYLELNDRNVHRYILRAFSDLTVSFRLRRRRTAATEERANRGTDGGPRKGGTQPGAQTSPSTNSGKL